MPIIKKISFLLLLLCVSTTIGKAQSLSLISWNIRDFGKTKDSDEIHAIAEIVRDFDIIAIQEVVAGDGGAQAVARLADELNRMGAKWDYQISDPTKSPPYKTERYAFIWKPNKATMIGRPWLEKSLEDVVYREPFLARFKIEETELTILNYHSRRFDENPEEEVVHFKDVVQKYASAPLIIAGDFNMSDDHEVFNSLYRIGYVSLLRSQPTTLKRKCTLDGGGYLSYAIDNIFYPKEWFQLIDGGVADYICHCDRLSEGRLISDHLAVYFKARMN